MSPSIPRSAGLWRRLPEHVNGELADVDWVPIRYLNKSFSRRTLFGFLRLAQVGLVTPLRDGMNLVAMEYLASQPPDDPGVLVLSRFAGAARYLPDALIVNPYDVDRCRRDDPDCADDACGGAVGAVAKFDEGSPLEQRRGLYKRFIIRLAEG